MNRLNTLLMILTLALLAPVIGCDEQMTTTGSAAGADGDYRTISTLPRRDSATARSHYERGVELMREDDSEGAIKAFGKALKADITYGPAHNNLGKLYFRDRDFHAAAWEFEYARELLPRNPEPLCNLGLCYEQDGQLDRAVEYHEKAVSLAGNEIVYKAYLARAMLKRGDRTPEVRELLEDILREDTRPEWLIMAKRYLSRIAAE